MNKDWIPAVCSLIEALGTIIAAVLAAYVAAYFAKKIAEGFKVYTYDKPEIDICELLSGAQSDIFVITALGDHLIEKIKAVIDGKLRAGVHIRYLLLEEEAFAKNEVYMHDKRSKSVNKRAPVLELLSEWKRKYPHLVEFRCFENYMTASYIGVDVSPNATICQAWLKPVIQVMIYQYHMDADDSPIICITREKEEKVFYTTVKSMEDMWDDAKSPKEKL